MMVKLFASGDGGIHNDYYAGMDAYQILGVSRSDDMATIKKAFRKGNETAPAVAPPLDNLICVSPLIIFEQLFPPGIRTSSPMIPKRRKRAMQEWKR